jgi:leucyl/phenylalanyl-tRNA--protein transferase
VGVPILHSDPASPFPPPDSALRDPDGLLAAGGDLSPTRLLNAYRQGIFPWFSRGDPILWWCPDPRMVFRTDAVRLSTRFRRSLRGCGWVARADTAFDAVVEACARTPRPGQRDTWITGDMRAAYGTLHRLGHAHSVEVFAGDAPDSALVGGIYGVAIGRMFFGESMFSGESGGSKAALAALTHRLRQWDWPLLDAQVENPHLRRLGAEAWPRHAFLDTIHALVAKPEPAAPWTGRFAALPVRELAAPPG